MPIRDILENDNISVSVAGIHFYTLNHSHASVDTCRTLGLKSLLNLPATVSVDDGAGDYPATASGLNC